MSLGGDFADAKLIKSLDDEDTDIVGDGAYTLKGTAAIQNTAIFGNALLCEDNGASLDSDAELSGFDQSDTAKTMHHFFWRTPTLAGQKGQLTFQNAASSSFKNRIFWDAGTRIKMQWVRSVDLSPGKPAISVTSTGGLFSTGVFSGVSAYINAFSASEGKIFKDGVDITLSIAEEASPTRPATGFGFVRIGNNFNGLDPARFMDHVTVIQSSSLSDAKAILLSANYHDTRGFGYRPLFISTDIINVSGGDIVALTGSGFGIDVTITVGGVTANNIARTDEANISFEVPDGLGPGPYDLVITNVASNVTFTVTAALSQKQTTWTDGGTSDRQARVGDGQTVSADWVIGGPTRWCDPNIQCTPWVRTSVKA